MNVLHGDSVAARLELNALNVIEKLQLSNTRDCLLEENGEEFVIYALRGGSSDSRCF
ncbi:hypothetical protein J2TS4_43750 [Paenibacillus sp. J2TS4]|nr:hypothetical protein J2TS4_43750 [Paenibacillus sp. J2TS4]